MERVTFSPGEFAALFGKSQTWGYRQIYAGKVTTITDYGRILIPAAEVERILATAAKYEGLKKKPNRTKEEFQAMKPVLRLAWRDFVHRKTAALSKKSTSVPRVKAPSPHPDARKEALKRLPAPGSRSR
jgi:hypothetical protein